MGEMMSRFPMPELTRDVREVEKLCNETPAGPWELIPPGEMDGGWCPATDEKENQLFCSEARIALPEMLARLKALRTGPLAYLLRQAIGKYLWSITHRGCSTNGVRAEFREVARMLGAKDPDAWLNGEEKEDGGGDAAGDRSEGPGERPAAPGGVPAPLG